MFSETCRKCLFDIVSAYQAATKESLATISRHFYGNRVFLGRYKRGSCSITTLKADAMVAKFRAEWPEGFLFPEPEPFRDKNIV
jgi:hypothetical protein